MRVILSRQVLGSRVRPKTERPDLKQAGRFASEDDPNGPPQAMHWPPEALPDKGTHYQHHRPLRPMSGRVSPDSMIGGRAWT